MKRLTAYRLLTTPPALAILMTTGMAIAQQQPKYNLPTPVAPLTKDIYALHTLTSWVAFIIMLIVIALVIYIVMKFRKSKGYEPDQNFHKSWFGRWSWVLVPLLVLGIDMAIAGRAASTLKALYNPPDAEITIKVTGSQWKWTYEYMDDGIRFDSNLNKELLPTDKNYLRDVDNPLVLPIDTNVRFLHTASDVLHNWWVPAIAYKVDSVPGFINETHTRIEKIGTYRGQCSEICGAGHAFMPTVVKAVSKEDYAAWKSETQAKMIAAKAEASADKQWSMDELMTRGEAVYNKTCVACHQATGLGIPGVFPALKGSPVTTGDLAKHISTVINGVSGTAMAAWKDQLNDLELAAVITYERNAWDNNKGDLAQPADIKEAR